MEASDSKPLKRVCLKEIEEQIQSHEVSLQKSNGQSIPGYNYSLKLTGKGIELVPNYTGKGGRKTPETVLMAIVPSHIRELLKSELEKRFPHLMDNFQFGSPTYSESVSEQFLENIKSFDNLPEILITTDFCAIYDKKTTHRIEKSGQFGIIHPIQNNNFQAFQPYPSMHLFAADAMVMVIDSTKFSNQSIPHEWYELLNPSYEKSIVFPGNKEYYHNTAFFPFIESYGLQAIRALKPNIKSFMHPSAMLYSISQNNLENAAIYIMPYSYALRTKQFPFMRIIWPEDGAIAIPLQMMVKKSAYEKYSKLIQAFGENKMVKILNDAGLMSADVNTSSPSKPLRWPSPDLIQATDFRQLKNEIRNILHINY